MPIARDEIKNISETLTEYDTALSNVLSGFEYLEIEEEGPAEGEAEISLLIPRAAINSELKGFGEDARFLYDIVRLFSEAATGSVEEPRVIQTSSSELLLLIDFACKTTALILMVVLVIQSVISGTYKLKTLKAEAEADEENKKIVQAIDERMAAELKKGSVQIEKLLLQRLKKYVPPERKNEVTTTVKKTIAKLIRKMDIGYKIDGDAGAPEETVEEGKDLTQEQNEQIRGVEEVKRPAAEIRHHEIPIEPVLNLPAPNEDEPAETKDDGEEETT